MYNEFNSDIMIEVAKEIITEIGKGEGMRLFIRKLFDIVYMFEDSVNTKKLQSLTGERFKFINGRVRPYNLYSIIRKNDPPYTQIWKQHFWWDNNNIYLIDKSRHLLIDSHYKPLLSKTIDMFISNRHLKAVSKAI